MEISVRDIVTLADIIHENVDKETSDKIIAALNEKSLTFAKRSRQKYQPERAVDGADKYDKHYQQQLNTAAYQISIAEFKGIVNLTHHLAHSLKYGCAHPNHKL